MEEGPGPRQIHPHRQHLGGGAREDNGGPPQAASARNLHKRKQVWA